MGFSGGEFFLIIVVILVLFGADKIPELVRSFGKGMNEFKKAADEIKRELAESANDIKQEFTESVLDVKKEALDISRDVGDDIRSGVDGLKSDFAPYEDLAKDDIATEVASSEETVVRDGNEVDLPELPKPVSRKKS
jgi:TatA/E family protein of Tat protein translocase